MFDRLPCCSDQYVMDVCTIHDVRHSMMNIKGKGVSGGAILSHVRITGVSLLKVCVCVCVCVSL